MKPKEYIKAALRTEAYALGDIRSRLFDLTTIRLLHAAIGASTEAGELTDAIKKHVFYGKPIDRANLIEEAGDLFWYLSILCDELGISFEEVMSVNIRKLKERYPDKFTTEKAVNRNLSKERRILEEADESRNRVKSK